MSHNYQPADPGRIDVNNPHAVEYWGHELRCTKEQLLAAVASAGDHVTAVRDALAKAQQQSDAIDHTIDPGRIDVRSDHHMTHWTRELGVSQDRLRKVVDEVGPHVAAVREALDKGR